MKLISMGATSMGSGERRSDRQSPLKQQLTEALGPESSTNSKPESRDRDRSQNKSTAIKVIQELEASENEEDLNENYFVQLIKDE